MTASPSCPYADSRVAACVALFSVFEAHSNYVNALAVQPDGRIASGSRDHTVRLWDPARKRPTRQFVADAEIRCIVSAVSGLIVAGSADGAVHCLREVG